MVTTSQKPSKASLTVQDSWAGKWGLALAHEASDGWPPVYVPSHRRHEFIATLNTFPELRHHAYVVVAAEEENQYREHYPDVNLLLIPPMYRGLRIGIGRARQFILDHASEQGYERILMIDDDITNLRVRYMTDEGVSTSSRHLSPEDRVRFRNGMLGLFMAASSDAMDAPGLNVTITGGEYAVARGDRVSEIRWATNQMKMPAAMCLWHVPRFELFAGELDLQRFNVQAEDLYAAMEVVWNGGSIAVIPSFTPVSYEQRASGGQSVIRTPEIEDILFHNEHKGLMEMPYADFLITKYENGFPLWHRPNWKKLAAERGLVQVERRWDE